MRGSIVKRSKTSWALVIDQGRDPTTGKRRQKWVKFEVPRGVGQREAHKQAEAKLAELLHQVDTGTFVDGSRTTLVEYLRDWHQKAVVPRLRPKTADGYRAFIEHHIAKAPIALVPLQKLRTSDLEAFYATVKRAPSSVGVLHAVIHRALKTAVRDRLLIANPAAAVEHRPRTSKDRGQVARQHCWTADEARAFLAATQGAGAQSGAFYALALDTGARASELLGLTWADVDLDGGIVTISRQLERFYGRCEWGPTKTGRSRTVTLGADTVARLRAHRKQQRELMMANRTTYVDHGLVFGKEHADLQTPTARLGEPVPALARVRFHKLARVADVKRIKFHGLRHTCATLLLAAGVPVQVVAQRLGHAQVTMTLETYAHATPNLQRDAAAKLTAILAG